MRIFSLNFTNRLGVDLGSSRTRIWTDKKGLVVDEATCLAVDTRARQVLAVGDEAVEMVGRVGKHIKVVYPIRRGVVFDLEYARIFVRNLLDQAVGRSFLTPSVMVSMPASSTKVDQQIVVDLFQSLGMGEVSIIAQPLAAIIGAGVPVADASGAFILQMGAGVVEGAVVSLGSMVAWESTLRAGFEADLLLQKSLRQGQKTLVSFEDCEEIKQRVGSVFLNDVQPSFAVTGKSLDDNAPTELLVNSLMIAEPFLKLAERYDELLKRLLAKIPPELTTDIIDKGLLLSGGWSRLTGLEDWLIKKLGVPVSVVEEPDRAVIEGIATVSQHLEMFKSSLGYRN
ncbi:MAG: rod shape-determining protein [Patescibacteria group bacterium]